MWGRMTRLVDKLVSRKFSKILGLMLVFVVLLGFLNFALSDTVVNQYGAFTKDFDYIVYKSGSTYYTIIGSSGEVEYSGSNQVTAQETALDGLSGSGGVISCKGFNWSGTYGDRIIIVQDNLGEIRFLNNRGSVLLPQLASDPNNETWGSEQAGYYWYNTYDAVYKFWNGTHVVEWGSNGTVGGDTYEGDTYITGGENTLSPIYTVWVNGSRYIGQHSSGLVVYNGTRFDLAVEYGVFYYDSAFVRAGYYYTDQPINWNDTDDNTCLYGEGSTVTHIISSSATYGIYLQGAVPPPSYTLQNVTLRGFSIHGSTNHGIYTFEVQKLVCIDVWIYDTGADGLNLYSVNDAFMSNVHIMSCGGDGFQIDGVHEGYFVQCWSSDNTGVGYKITSNDGLTMEIAFIECSSEDNNGVYGWSMVKTVGEIEEVLIMGCTSDMEQKSFYASGVRLLSIVGCATWSTRFCEISSCYNVAVVGCHANNIPSSAYYFVSTNRVTFVANTVYTAGGSNFRGVHFSTVCYGVIADNVFHMTGSTGSGSGIYLSGVSQYNIIHDNQVYDWNAYGIELTVDTSYNKVHDNGMYSCTSGSLSDSGTGNIIRGNDFGYKTESYITFTTVLSGSQIAHGLDVIPNFCLITLTYNSTNPAYGMYGVMDATYVTVYFSDGAVHNGSIMIARV